MADTDMMERYVHHMHKGALKIYKQFEHGPTIEYVEFLEHELARAERDILRAIREKGGQSALIPFSG